MESRLALDRERLFETEVIRTESRLEADAFSTRVQAARTEGELSRTETEVSRLASNVESLSFRLSAEREAREVEDRSLRECVEDLVEALKENMAKLTTDMENIKIIVREETANSSGRAQRQAMEMIDGQLQSALGASEDRFREEMRLEHAGLRDAQRSSAERLGEDLARLSAQQADYRITYRTSLEELEARLREDMRGRALESPPDGPVSRPVSPPGFDRGALDSMELKWREENERLLAAHREQFNAKFQDQLGIMEVVAKRVEETEDSNEILRANFENVGQDITRLNSFMDDERARQRLNVEELEVKLRGELARTTADLRAEVAGGGGRSLEGSGGGDSSLRASLDALDARLMDELSGQHSRLQGMQRSSLQQLETDLREELARVSSENSKSHSTLRDLLSEHRSEIDSSYSRINNTSRLAIADVDAKVEELASKSLKIESLQRAAIQTLGEELRDEMVRSQRGNRGGGISLEDVEARLEAHAQRVEAQMRRSSESVDEMLRLEIGRIDGEQRSRYSSLQETIAGYRQEGSSGGGQASPDVLDRQEVEQLRNEVEELLSECRRIGSGPPPPVAAPPPPVYAAAPQPIASGGGVSVQVMEDLVTKKFASLVDGLSFEDAEGRRWYFHDPRECLDHVSRRLRELQIAIAREQKLREESLRLIDTVKDTEDVLVRRVDREEVLLGDHESRLARNESESQRFSNRLQRQDEDSINASLANRRISREIAEDRAEQQLRRTETQLRSEQSTLRRVENELASERDQDDRGLDTLESDLQELGSNPRITVTDVGLSSSVASSLAPSVAGSTAGGTSVASTPVTKTLPSSSRTSTPMTQTKRTTTTRSVSPSQRTMQSSRSANGIGGEARAEGRSSQIVAGPAQSARTSVASAPLPGARPDRTAGPTLKSRMAGGSSRPSASPTPGRPGSTMKGSVRARPAT